MEWDLESKDSDHAEFLCFMLVVPNAILSLQLGCPACLFSAMGTLVSLGGVPPQLQERNSHEDSHELNSDLAHTHEINECN